MVGGEVTWWPFPRRLLVDGEVTWWPFPRRLLVDGDDGAQVARVIRPWGYYRVPFLAWSE